MFLIGIVVFYLLYTVSAPLWCYILNSIAIFASIFRCASIVGSFIHETNADIECEMKNMNGEVDG